MSVWLFDYAGRAAVFLSVFFVLVGLFLTGLSLFYFIKGMKMPKEICVREGEWLTFLGQTFPLKEIVNVRYRLAHARGWSYRWGRLTVVRKDGRSYVAYFVADVEEAHDRLIALMRECTAKESE